MAKKVGIKETLDIGKKKKLKQTTSLNLGKIEEATKNIEKKESEKLVRVTIDIPESRYKRMKIKVVTERKTVRSYFLELLEKDINF